MLFSATLAGSAMALPNDVDRPGKGDWCYDPVSTPSKADRVAFVNDISPIAIEAERKWGVPAPVIAAMSIVESGFGKTRLAIKANNILAFKWPGDALAAGRAKFILWCQPDRDKGNVYPSFPTRADAIDFVASRLNLSRYYSKATLLYSKEVAGGADRTASARRWLAAIAPMYNWNPNHYISEAENVAADPIGDGSRSLWTLEP